MHQKRHVYTKFLETYKRERARRKQVLLVYEQGFTQAQIAAQLGCSTKTVCRDVKKLRRFRVGQQRVRNAEFLQELRQIESVATVKTVDGAP
jgi:DNA-binding transcriptional regulator LsrR (DeoR family)